MAQATRNITPAKRKANPPSGDLSIIIPAAGMGHRMKSYGPKALIRLYQEITLIERQIELLWSVYPNAEILVVIGFEGEKIRKKLSNYPVRFISNPIHQSTNVLYSIGLGMQAIISEEVMIVYGDLIFNENAIRNLRGSSKVVVDNSNSLKKEEVGVVQNKNTITNFSFGVEPKWAQITYLTGKEMQIFKEISTKKETSQWLGYEGLNYIIEKGGIIEAHHPKSMKIFEVDVAKDLEKIPKSKLKLG
tara:strand:- start:2795 stop:3535 length:741 start_codon:yes stop_codon:yes gene_type:complete